MSLPIAIDELDSASVVSAGGYMILVSGGWTRKMTIAEFLSDSNVVDLVQKASVIGQNSQSANYVTVLADTGKHILHPSTDNNARTFTIAANSSVAYGIGTVITFVNQINTLTIAITSDTLTLAGAGTTGSRTLAANGIATALKIASTSWIISGTGIS